MTIIPVGRDSKEYLKNNLNERYHADDYMVGITAGMPQREIYVPYLEGVIIQGFGTGYDIKPSGSKSKWFMAGIKNF